MTAGASGAYAALLDRAAVDAIPISALVELTNACNVDCEHCYLDLVPDRKIGALSTEEWKRVFRELADEGTLFLTLSGGELLVRRDWFELAAFARELDFALRLYTNGTLIDEAAADRIASLTPLGVEISLLGGTAETHDAITRRRGSFARTTRGVRLLRERGVPVLLKCVLMKKNVGEQRAIEAIAGSLGCSSFFDLQISPKNDGSCGPKALVPDDADLHAVAQRLFAAARPEDGPTDRAARLASAPCSAGRRTCHIGPTGDVFPCTQWTVPAGNLRASSFRAIWRGSPALAEVRSKRVRDFATCGRCDLLDVCTPCMALSVLERGALDGPSPTKCRSTLVRARALGVPGFPAGLDPEASLAGEPPANLVQLRVPARARRSG